MGIKGHRLILFVSQGRMVFMQFIEAIVQCICECTVSNLKRRLQLPTDRSAGAPAEATLPSPIYCKIAEIREEAKQLLDIFGLLSLPSVLALTKRPLKRGSALSDLPGDERDTTEGAQPAKEAAPKQPRPVTGLRLLKAPHGKGA